MFELKKPILFFYDYFYPGYRAGGPIQSLTNLCTALEKDYDIRVITSAYDLHVADPYPGIIIDNWNKITIPGSNKELSVYYAGKTVQPSTLKKIMTEANPSVVYFNNIYSSHFFRMPLKASKALAQRPKVVICPRGMFQKGALAVKPVKKKLYLTWLRYMGLLNNAFWHATNEEEADDIRTYFPINKGVIIASNIPKQPYQQITFPHKDKDRLKLVYLSLIAEKKNLLLLLQVMEKAGSETTLDIYGPITDAVYWQQCENLMGKMQGGVQYKGDVQPANVQEVLSGYHALILLTKGENFGHALYESLSVGRPVITSFFTPWNDLQQKSAGLNADIHNMQDCLNKLALLAGMEQQEYNIFCTGANKVAITYYQTLDTSTGYHELFATNA